MPYLKSSSKLKLTCSRNNTSVGCCHGLRSVLAGTVWADRPNKGESYGTQVCLWYHVGVANSLNSLKSKPQLLKLKWSKDMTKNVRRATKMAAKGACERRAKARDENFGHTLLGC